MKTSHITLVCFIVQLFIRNLITTFYLLIFKEFIVLKC